ncbi:unnamed protein product [Didymodactylos carnosus]|uniref:EF-hand domain-containing protein n=1 Tax=Didymodactylos carnosus TaxID=1234261 RepID=A0A8S2PDY4_9BILA|nr:unnamed protein product [Didymodactylos carnosus]CAF4044183.1 unnamed protein product [Didymodactylos carnosus]
MPRIGKTMASYGETKTYGLTEDKFYQHQAEFRLLDLNNNGFINVLELKDYLKRNGVTAKDEDITHFLKFDTNKDGAVSFDEYMQMMGGFYIREKCDSIFLPHTRAVLQTTTAFHANK